MPFVVDPHLLRRSAEARDRWYPYAVPMPIPEADTQRHIVARIAVLHSMAGPGLTSIEALRRYWERDDIHIEATAALDFTGRMAQMVPIDVRADCNASANGFSSSVETQDNGSATLAGTAWSPEQCEQLAGWLAWQHMNPLSLLLLVRAPEWDGYGAGGHRDFPEWSVYVGKTCPGDARVAQIPGIIARANAIVDLAYHVGPNPPAPQIPTPPAPPAPGPRKETIDMLALDFGVPPGDPHGSGHPADSWWTMLTWQGDTLTHVKSPADQMIARAGIPREPITEAELSALLENVQTVGPSPFDPTRPGNPAPNAALHAQWLAAAGR